MTSRAFLAISLGLYLAVAVMAQDRAAMNEQFVRATQLESQDPAGANKLYEEGVRQGHAQSMVMLGYRLLYGTGAAQDLPRAFTLFSTAAKAGDRDAQFFLALCYLEGLGTRKNAVVARETLLQPADSGQQYAQYTLAIMLEAGEGGPKREAAARRWLDRAASGEDRALAARAADFRNKLDAKLFATDNSTGQALTALFFVALFAAATTSGDGGGGVVNPSTPDIPGNGMSRSTPTPPPCRPTPFYPNNPTKTVMGDITNGSLGMRGC